MYILIFLSRRRERGTGNREQGRGGAGEAEKKFMKINKNISLANAAK
jgi:hypothetical protein